MITLNMLEATQENIEAKKAYIENMIEGAIELIIKDITIEINKDISPYVKNSCMHHMARKIYTKLVSEQSFDDIKGIDVVKFTIDNIYEHFDDYKNLFLTCKDIETDIQELAKRAQQITDDLNGELI